MCPTRRDAEKEGGIHERSEIWRALHKASRSLVCNTSDGLAKVADIMLIISVLVAAVVITSSRIPVASEVCSKGAAQDVTFSINGRRNVTGHWIIKMGVQQKDLQPAIESGPWHLDVQARTSQPCVDGAIMQLETHLTVAPPPARPGYELNAALGSRYKLHLRPQTWVEALGSCEAEGAHLAVVNGEAEAAMLRALFARHPVINDTTWAGAAWVGFHDRHTEGEYLTVLGERVDESGYNKWIASQPDNKDYKMPPDVDSDCGGIHRNALLDDLPCSARYVFICEQELW